MKKLYVDDIRIPLDPKWTIVRNYNEFVNIITKEGLEKFEIISLDHDLGDVLKNSILKFSEYNEKTGMDCAKFLVNKSLDSGVELPLIYTHSDNNVGSDNIIKYINNYLKFNNLPETCKLVRIEHKIS